MTPLGASGGSHVSSIAVDCSELAVGGACSSGAEMEKRIHTTYPNKCTVSSTCYSGRELCIPAVHPNGLVASRSWYPVSHMLQVSPATNILQLHSPVVASHSDPFTEPSLSQPHDSQLK